ncbi:conserved hypothetical protein [Thiomonas sp. X19]|uniref:aldo/keto reductase n=1 Tax=Thiomonas sp. X19 TaxID=1050370 RepID=UPI000B7609A9|nr:aldo/keto reductase [Thiomonas sp. X19]SCC95548.1 conserved hypothetical protein [Thiomonas sp. X19]
MNLVQLGSGEQWPALGLGTWRFGEDTARHASEIAAVRRALELGYRVLDTAEMYGEGGAERVVGEALADAMHEGVVKREQVLVVSKVYPHNASATGVQAACERSLRRLGLEQIDLYLLHWRGSVPLEETLEGFTRLVASGRIRHWGVSNFDLQDMHELLRLGGGTHCATNQVYYAASSRGVEFDLLPWMQGQRMPLMAYSPLDEGKLAHDTRLAALAQALGLSAAQLALAWVLRQPGVMAIPKAGSQQHLRDNLAAASTTLDAATCKAIDQLFPSPRGKQPLAMI